MKLSSKLIYWNTHRRVLMTLLSALLLFVNVNAQRQMENLGRGMVAVRAENDRVFVSWRLLGHEPQNLPFNLYRSANGGAPEKINADPIVTGTNFTDTTVDPTLENAYFVRPVINGVELEESAAYTLPANAPDRPYFTVPLEPTDFETYVHMVWVGDLDGDGEYDYVVTRIPEGTGDPRLLDAYLSDGTFLWRVNFGPNSVDPNNIEPPASTINAGHNDGVTVYDLDGDGRSEVVIISANGVTYGDGDVLTYGDDVTQFISVLDGETGALRARAQVPDDYIEEGPMAGHFGIAYLDGVHPSFVFKGKNRIGSGAFNLMVTTWDFDGTDLTERWKFSPGTADFPNFHQIRIIDLDGDGRDEIADGGYVLDDDGSVLYNLADEGVVHGDRFHIGDLDPNRPGLEGFAVQQNNPSGLRYYIYDAATGEMIHKHHGAISDIGRGIVADISADHVGYEYWAFDGIHEIQTGEVISPEPRRPWPNFRIWWDGDVMSEVLNRELVEKWNPEDPANHTRLLSAGNDGAVDSWRDAAQFYGDILGDWREEIIYEKSDHSALMIYTTPIPTDVRLYTLPHNPGYRAGFTVKGYLQSHMVDYYLGHGMTTPPAPDILPVLGGGTEMAIIAGFHPDTGHDDNDRITNNSTPTVAGIAPPGSTVTLSRIGAGDDIPVVADGDGNWTHTYTSPLADGEHYFLARLDGMEARYSPPFLIEIETVAPSMPVIELVAASGADGFTVMGTAEPASRMFVHILGVPGSESTMVDEDGFWSVSFEDLGSVGAMEMISAHSEDVAGNLSGSAMAPINFSMTVPEITAVSPDTGVDANDGVTIGGNLVLHGTAAPDAEVSILLIGEGLIGETTADVDGLWEFNHPDANLPDGVYTFSAVETGGLGAEPFTVKIDATEPVVSAVGLHAPTTDTSSATEITFRVNFSEPVAGVSESAFDLVTTGSLTGLVGSVESVESSGAQSFDVVVESLSGEGTIQLTVNDSGTGITDIAGNVLADGFSDGAVFNRILLGNGTWTRTLTGGNWSTNSNWQGGIIAHGFDTTADFSTLELSEDIEVILDESRIITQLVFGDQDVSSAAGWLVRGDDSDAVLEFVSDLETPGITVGDLADGHAVTIAARLGGAGFAKDGSGTLVLTGEGTLSGRVGVDEGEMRIGTGARFQPGSVVVNGSETVFRISDGEVVSGGTVDLNGDATLIIDGGIVSVNGLRGSDNSSGNSIHFNGGQLSTGYVEIRRSTDSNLRFNTGFVLPGGEAQIGEIRLGTSNSNGMMSVEGADVEVTGSIELGNQNTGGRGGHIRVTDGSLQVGEGIVMVLRDTNAASTSFLGGVSTIEKFTLGSDASIENGTATILLDGGTLYLGAGGIVSHGVESFAANVELASGVLAAKSGWSTTLPMTLITEDSTVTVQAANATGSAREILLGGEISGPGGLLKTGTGRLILAGENSFVGPLFAHDGELVVNGEIAAGAGVEILDHARLSGAGSIARAVALQPGGTISPGAGSSGSLLSLDSLEWHAGGVLEFTLGDGARQLEVNGELSKTGSGTHAIVIDGADGLEAGQSYTLVSFASTDFSAEDFTLVSTPPGLEGDLTLSGNNLILTIATPPPPTPYEEFADTTFPEGAEKTGPEEDYNGDGISNFLSFAFGVDPITGEGSENLPRLVKAESDGADGLVAEIEFTRPQDSPLHYGYEASSDLHSWSPLELDDMTDGYTVDLLENDEESGTVVQARVSHPDHSTFFVRVIVE